MACKANNAKSQRAISLMLLIIFSLAESTKSPISAGKIRDAAVDSKRKSIPRENSNL